MRLGGGEGGYECILNEATGDDCSTVCSSNGYSSCASVGTDGDECSNGLAYSYTDKKGCHTISIDCGDTMAEITVGPFPGTPVDCSGHNVKWTYCHCE